MIMKATLLCLLCAATVVTTGCASYDRQYVNWRGDVHACDQFGFGNLGAQLASRTHLSCTNSMRELGYLDVASNGLSGLSVTQRMTVSGNAPILISAVYPESSAAKAGIRAGDELIEIDRVLVKSLHLAQRKLFGKAGSVVLVKTRRGNVTSVDELVRQSQDDSNGNAVVVTAGGGLEAPY